MLGKKYIIPSLALLVILTLVFVGPVSQRNSYHTFADQREIFGISNFMNVVTNLPFGLIAFLGFSVAGRFGDKRSGLISYFIFTGFMLLTFGSGYYHLYPENITLVYDRIPMSIIFMSFFSFIIYDRIDNKNGYLAFILLNIIGIATVMYWIYSEGEGRMGDLRWYGMVQFFPIIAIPLILWIYKSPFNYVKAIIPIFLMFGFAKFAEHFDVQIYRFFGQIVSGHSIKHLFMAGAGYYIVSLIEKRSLQADQP